MIEYVELEDREKLIYDIVFSDDAYVGVTPFEINLFDYIKDLSELNDFTEYVINTLKESNFEIIEDVLIMTNEMNVWKLKIKITITDDL